MQSEEKAQHVWKVLAGALAFNESAHIEDVLAHLNSRQTPEIHIEIIQYILAGSGYATEGFDPDGILGPLTFKSIQNLWDAIT